LTASTNTNCSPYYFVDFENHRLSTMSTIEGLGKLKMKLIHEGDFANMIPFMPRVSTVTLSEGWDLGLIEKFTSVISEVVALNPILAGRVVKSKKGVYVEMGAFSTSKHDFGNVHDFRNKVPTIEGLANSELIDFIEKNIVPFIAEKQMASSGSRSPVKSNANVADEIKHGLPLFEANLFHFGQSKCAYHISMSHALGDATTYYMLVDQISCLLKGDDVSRINWDNPHTTSHELYAPNLDKSDMIKAKYGTPIGIIWKMITGGSRKSNLIFIDSRAIQKKKDEMVGAGNDYLSSNDIITAAICQINNTSKFVLINMDIRGRNPNLTRNDGGTLLSNIPMPMSKSKDPNVVRQTVNKTYYPFGKFVPPTKYMIQGKSLSFTNWSSRTKLIKLDNIRTICHLPSSAFVSEFPLDVALIFRFSDECIAVSHNFKKTDQSEGTSDLLNSITL